MTLATLLSRTQQGLEATLVRVEVDVGSGLPSFSIVGLPEAVVKESKDRVRAALGNCGFEFPAGRITVNLAPADLPKEGGRFDLPIAVGILVASGQLAGGPFDRTELYGELSLGGDLHSIRGALPTALHAMRAAHSVVLPTGNLAEAAVVRGGRILGAGHLLEVCRYASGRATLQEAPPMPEPAPRRVHRDLVDVIGQPLARRALEIAAAGGHNLLFIGPPGSGKSMLAQRLPGVLPPLSDAEALESAAIRSLAGLGWRIEDWGCRPFRCPHHTASAVAMVGGGGRPRPGEISLAHHGVLFLDELPEFDRHVLEVLREPLETGCVVVSRAARQAEFPAEFQLVAAMNPCPCGHLGDPEAQCRCPPERIASYRSRVSGPLLDRIDLHVEVPRVPARDLLEPARSESSAVVAGRVAKARQIQHERQGRSNARIADAILAAHVQLDGAAARLLDAATRQLGLSARAHRRVLRVARTIADLAGAAAVDARHVAEAITLRRRDRRVTAGGVAAISG